MYITTLDFSEAIYREIRETISRYSETFVSHHSLRAEREVEARLSTRYDIAVELVKTGNSRNQMLVGITRDIAIYYMYLTQETRPNIRVKAYDDAIALLKDIAAGKASLDLPPAPTDPGESQSGLIAWGSNQRRFNEI